ncbi:MAG TPA: cupredoxin domain-containing protein, partial [Actinomycetota bacterium]|nr:cupredoxin domain-containing protein [Actinomycetota bacterium]
LRAHPTSAAGPPPPSRPTMPAATCSPDGGVLRLAAHGFAFDRDCLAAHAGRPFRIVFDNGDEGVPHNVAVYADPAGTEQLFSGEPVTGPGSATYRVGPLDPGTYLFRCDFHPTQMRGALVIA